MIIPCPNCGSRVELNSPPARGPVNDGSEAWTCLWCPMVVCVDCYHEHTRKQHPDALSEIKRSKKK